jgi:hypothetical protein
VTSTVAIQKAPTAIPTNLANVPPPGSLTAPSQGSKKIKNKDNASAILRMSIVLQEQEEIPFTADTIYA